MKTRALTRYSPITSILVLPGLLALLALPGSPDAAERTVLGELYSAEF